METTNDFDFERILIKSQESMNNENLNHVIANENNNLIEKSVIKLTEFIKEEICKKINYLNDSLTVLEFSNDHKENAILELMFALHDCTNSISNLKVNYKNVLEKPKFNPALHLRAPFQSRASKNSILLSEGNETTMNKSTLSVVSKRSVSTSRVDRKLFGADKEKTKFGAQKVTINIDENSSQVKTQNKRGMSTDNYKKAKILEKNLQVHNNIKTINPSMKGSNKSTKGNIKKDLVKMKTSVNKNFLNSSLKSSKATTQNDSELGINNDIIGSNNSSNSNLKKNNGKKAHHFESKTQNKLNTKPENLFIVPDTRLSNITCHTIKPTFKFEPKKKNLSGSGSGLLQVNNNNNNIFSSPGNGPRTTIDIHSAIDTGSFQSCDSSNIVDPKNLNNHSRANSDQVKSTNHKFNLNSINELRTNTKMFNFFNNKNNSQIFMKVFEFMSSTKEKVQTKQVSRVVRETYLKSEITNLEKLIEYKHKQENPLYNIPITDDDIFSKNLILSNQFEIYKNSKGFENLVILIYITLQYPINIEKLISVDQNTLICFINDMEQSGKNVYSKYGDIIFNLKNNKQVYLNLKQLKDSQNIFFDYITDLNNDVQFDVFINLANSINKLVDVGPNFELVIDVEIYNYKLEILKTYLKLI